MTITPRFELSQTETHVCLNIRVPHVRVSSETVQIVVVPNDDNADVHDYDDNNDYDNDINKINDLCVLKEEEEEDEEQETENNNEGCADIGEQQQQEEETATRDDDDLLPVSYDTTAGGSVFHFSSPPYLLILHFAQRLDEAACESDVAVYEPTIHNGTITVQLKKLHPAWWPDLDLVGKLKQKQTETSNWLQEVVTTANEEETRTTKQENKDIVATGLYGFARLFRGIFADLGRDDIAKEMFELPWPPDEDGDSSVLNSNNNNQQQQLRLLRQERRAERRVREEELFDADRYVQDLEISDDYIYQLALAMEPHWRKPQEQVSNQLEQFSINNNASQQEEPTEMLPPPAVKMMTSEEQSQLLSIPYPLFPSSSPHVFSRDKTVSLWVGLLDILFAYMYDHLTTDGEPTVESAWCITRLSSSLSCLEDWIIEEEEEEEDNNEKEKEMDSNNSQDNRARGNTTTNTTATTTTVTDLLESVIVSSVRRVLIYPYLRNLEFGLRIWQQEIVGGLLKHPENCIRNILRCLLQCRTILQRSELYYLGNILYVDPYLLWLQQQPPHSTVFRETLTEVIRTLQTIFQTHPDQHYWKRKVELDLKRIEREAFTDEGDDDNNSRCSDSSSSSSGDDSDGKSVDTEDSSSSSSSSSDKSEKDQYNPAIVVQSTPTTDCQEATPNTTEKQTSSSMTASETTTTTTTKRLTHNASDLLDENLGKLSLSASPATAAAVAIVHPRVDAAIETDSYHDDGDDRAQTCRIVLLDSTVGKNGGGTGVESSRRSIPLGNRTSEDAALLNPVSVSPAAEEDEEEESNDQHPLRLLLPGQQQQQKPKGFAVRIEEMDGSKVSNRRRER